jgi:hypothetical protein
MLRKAQLDEAARRIEERIAAEDATFQRCGEPGLTAAEVRQIADQAIAEVTGRADGGAFSEVAPSDTAVHEFDVGLLADRLASRPTSRRRTSAKPLRETKGEERRRAVAEAADELLPDLAGVSPAGEPPPVAPHELYAKDPATWHAWARASADRLLPDLPGT